MKKTLIGGLACMLVLTGCGNSNEPSNKEGEKTFKIGIIQQAEHPALESAQTGMKAFLESKTDAKFEFVVKNAQGDNGTMDMITKQFVSDDVDLIYSIGTNASQAAVSATLGKELPVVFNAVTDAVDAKLVASNEKPGANVTGVSDAAPLQKQLEMIREFLPDAKTIGMIYNIGEPNGKLQVEQVEALAPSLGFSVEKKGISVTTDIATAAEQLSGSVDCIYNITDNMVVSATGAIVDKANGKTIPVFAAEDGQMAAGLLASDSISYDKLGQQAGNVIYDILINGKKAGDIPVETAKETTLMINEKVAKALGIEIPQTLLDRATIADK